MLYGVNYSTLVCNERPLAGSQREMQATNGFTPFSFPNIKLK